jgi:hypothetical protein
LGQNKTPVSKNTQEIPMSKRAIYSIPLAGLALTSVGCKGDEPPAEVDELKDANLTTDTAFGAANPYSVTAYDLGAAVPGLVCDITVTVSDIDLTGYDGVTTINGTTSNCTLNGTANATYDQSNDNLYDTTVVPAVAASAANVTYTINLVNQADATQTITLDCTRTANDVVCTDDNNAAWEFTAE